MGIVLRVYKCGKTMMKLYGMYEMYFTFLWALLTNIAIFLNLGIYI